MSKKTEESVLGEVFVEDKNYENVEDGFHKIIAPTGESFVISECNTEEILDLFNSLGDIP